MPAGAFAAGPFQGPRFRARLAPSLPLHDTEVPFAPPLISAFASREGGLLSSRLYSRLNWEWIVIYEYHPPLKKPLAPTKILLLSVWQNKFTQHDC